MDICIYPVDICIYPVDICIYPVDICIYPVDICIYPVDICIYPVDICKYPVDICIYPVDICKYPVDICIYPVDICIYPVDICIYPVDICKYPVDICIYPSFDDQFYSDFLPKRHPIYSPIETEVIKLIMASHFGGKFFPPKCPQPFYGFMCCATCIQVAWDKTIGMCTCKASLSNCLASLNPCADLEHPVSLLSMCVHVADHAFSYYSNVIIHLC